MTGSFDEQPGTIGIILKDSEALRTLKIEPRKPFTAKGKDKPHWRISSLGFLVGANSDEAWNEIVNAIGQEIPKSVIFNEDPSHESDREREYEALIILDKERLFI